MRRILVAFLLGAALTALSGQTVLAWPDGTEARLSSTPAGTVAGGTWTVDISFVANGRILTPDSFHPVVVITEVTTGASRTFTAQATSAPGVFRADVVFPSAGTWSYRVGPGVSGPFFDYAPVEISPAAADIVVRGDDQPVRDPSPLPLAALAIAVMGSLLGAGILLARRQPSRGLDQGSGAS